MKKGTLTWLESLIVTLVLCFVLQALQAFRPAAAQAAGGASVFVIGAATGTFVALVSAVPATFYDIKVASGTPQAAVKCWNANSISGLTDSVEANMIDDVVISSVSAAGAPTANFRDGQANRPAGRNASTGIACKKTAAGDVVFIEYQP